MNKIKKVDNKIGRWLELWGICKQMSMCKYIPNPIGK